MLDILIALLAFVVALGLLVTIHEYGHFWVARRMGVKVLRFCVGFGPILYSRYDKHGTQFAIAAIPLGGYVKMLDKREGAIEDDELPYEFTQKPVGKRIAIVLAGPAFNFLFAIVAFWLLFLVGVKSIAPVIGYVEPQSAAAEAGILPGDELLALGNREITDFESAHLSAIHYLGETGDVNLSVRQPHDNNKRQYLLPLNSARDIDLEPRDPFYTLFNIELGMPSIIGDVTPGYPAQEAGLLPGDQIVALGETRIMSWGQLQAVLQHYDQRLINVTVLRQGQQQHFGLIPRTVQLESESVVRMGIELDTSYLPDNYVRTQRYGPINALFKAVDKTYDLSVLSLKLFAKVITGQVGKEVLGGPISIAQGAGLSVQVGLEYFVAFLALISVSLGVVNLLPIPMLDGGHLLYYIIEAIRGKPVSESAQRVGFGIGLALVVSLMLMTLYLDIARLLH